MGFKVSTPKKIFNNHEFENLGVLVNSILWFISLATIISIFVPFSPGMPAASLDPSWVFGMNEAIAQGLSIGNDIIFTFGPYASIYTKTYHPATDFMMISGSSYLAFSYLVCFVILIKGVQWRWVIIFCALLAGLMYSRDALLFSLPLLAGLLTFKIIFAEEGRLVKSKFASIYILIAFAPLGLLPLIKGSTLPLCGAVAGLCSVFFAFSGRRVLAIMCLLSPMVSMVFFWMASGQSAGNLPIYFLNMVPIISGYTEAMAVEGNLREVILYLISSSFLLFAISTQAQINKTQKIFLCGIYFAFLFISFKAGFVRHDGHAVMAGTSILIAALLLPFVINGRIVFAAIIFSLISWFYIDGHYVKTSTERFANNIGLTYSSAWHGFKNRIENKSWLRRDFETAVGTLKKQASFPVLQGTTDIYSYNQSYLISSGSSWSPRPIFQSYSVYTPALAEKNRKHLLGDSSPDNVIFRVEPIDGRLPSMEDGASWPVLVSKYLPVRLENNFLFLRKNKNLGEIEEPSELTSGTYSLGESVDLPRSRQPLFAQIDIKKTIFGHIASVFFKPSQLRVTLELNNGLKKQYRIISGMAKSGFVISPLIESTADFGMLYGKEEFLDSKLVKSIVIAPRDGSTWIWNDEYTIVLRKIKNGNQVDISEVYGFDKFSDELLDSKMMTAEKCAGAIDVVNGMSLASGKISASSLISIRGWLAVSTDRGELPEAVYVVLTDAQGKHKILKAKVVPRPDVGAHFKRPELNSSGYSAMADTTVLQGEYTLGLAIKQYDGIKLCPQFKIPTFITN